MRTKPNTAIALELPDGIADVPTLVTRLNDRFRDIGQRIQAARQEIVNVTQPAAPSTARGVTGTAEVWYRYNPGSGYVFGFEGRVNPPTPLVNFGGAKIYLHWIEGYDGSTPLYDSRYLEIASKGTGGGPWHGGEPGFPLQRNFSQDCDVVFRPLDSNGVENEDPLSWYIVRVTVTDADIDTTWRPLTGDETQLPDDENLGVDSTGGGFTYTLLPRSEQTGKDLRFFRVSDDTNPFTVATAENPDTGQPENIKGHGSSITVKSSEFSLVITANGLS